MDFMGIGLLELFIVLFLVLVVFGPEKMIETARVMGKYARKFRMIASELTRQITAELDDQTQDLRTDVKSIRTELSADLKDVGDDLTRGTITSVGSVESPDVESEAMPDNPTEPENKA